MRRPTSHFGLNILGLFALLPFVFLAGRGAWVIWEKLLEGPSRASLSDVALERGLLAYVMAREIGRVTDQKHLQQVVLHGIAGDNANMAGSCLLTNTDQIAYFFFPAKFLVSEIDIKAPDEVSTPIFNHDALNIMLTTSDEIKGEAHIVAVQGGDRCTLTLIVPPKKVSHASYR